MNTVDVPESHKEAPLDIIAWALSGGRLPQEDARLVEEGISACMAAQGFEYPVVDRLVDATPTVGAFLKSLWTQGFQAIPSDDGLTSASDPLIKYLSTLTNSRRSAFFRALNGTAGDNVGPNPPEAATGCVADANRKVHGGTPEYSDVGIELKQSAETLKSSPRWAAAERERSSCMSDAGYQDFEDDLAKFRQRSPNRPATNRERDAAAAYARCSVRWFEATRGLQIDLIEKFAERYPEFSSMLESATWAR